MAASLVVTTVLRPLGVLFFPSVGRCIRAPLLRALSALTDVAQKTRRFGVAHTLQLHGWNPSWWPRAFRGATGVVAFVSPKDSWATSFISSDPKGFW